MILIANPLYDVVFKYLLEDKESARILLSTILEEEILDLEPRPHEQLLELESRSLTVYRLDFSAKIKTGPHSFKLVILEVQKAKLATDIMRFRRYLGKQYIHKDNVYTTESGELRPLPIVSIYFLAFGLPELNSPVIQVKRRYQNTRSHETIGKSDPFIESLTHDAYIVQLSKLGEPYLSDAERLLRIFDQHNQTDGGRMLRMDDTHYPQRFMRLKDRLLRAMAEEALRDQMDVEEDILEELGRLERTVDLKDKVLEEKDKALEAKDKALEEKDKALEQRDKKLEEQDKKLEALSRTLDEQVRRIEQLTLVLGKPS